jgi:hypothetical protein
VEGGAASGWGEPVERAAAPTGGENAESPPSPDGPQHG